MFLLVKTYKKPAVRQNRPFEVIEQQKQRRKPKAVKLGKLQLRRGMLYALAGVGILSVLALVNGYQQNMALRDIQIRFLEETDNAFLDIAAVTQLLTMDQGQELIGTPMGELDLKGLEEILRHNPFVRTAEVYKSARGILHVELALRRPLARLINNSGNYIYLDETGVKFPDSHLHSADVMLIRGDFEEAVADTFTCETVETAIPVMQYVRQDSFWNAWISEIAIAHDGELRLYPQLGDFSIEFGAPIHIKDKFNRLRDFLKGTLSRVGWRKYRSISVKFEGQVVARKR